MPKLNAQKTAVISLDIQTGIIGMVPGCEKAIESAARATAFARKQKMQLIHVGLGFEPGYPEVGNAKTLFQMLKEKQLFVKGSTSAEFHPSVYHQGDLIIYKQRISAFTSNTLAITLRSLGIEHLVLFGFATSGIVLSTVREAYDMDFQITVLEDASFDGDAEVHRVLTEKVFARQCSVMKVDAFIAENG